MSALLDTDVLIDALRGTPGAKAWLERMPTTVFAIPGIVTMELVAGCRNQGELRQLERFLNRFTIVWTEPAEFAQAYNLFATHWLASKLSIPDCLIAAMALSRGATVYSFNSKHFNVIAGLDVQEPYTRP